MVRHRLLEVSAVIPPIQLRRAVRREHKPEILQGCHFVLADLERIQIDTPLRRLATICEPVRLLIAAHDKLTGRHEDHVILGFPLGHTLYSDILTCLGPLHRDVLYIEPPGDVRHHQGHRHGNERIHHTIDRHQCPHLRCLHDSASSIIESSVVNRHKSLVPKGERLDRILTV